MLEVPAYLILPAPLRLPVTTFGPAFASSGSGSRKALLRRGRGGVMFGYADRDPKVDAPDPHGFGSVIERE